MRSRDDVCSDDFAESGSGSATSLNSGLYSAHVAADHHGHQTAANMKRMGMDAAAISSCTGLTAEEIGKL